VIGGIVLDKAALADFVEHPSGRMAKIVDSAVKRVVVVCVPTAALAECWAAMSPKSQAFLALFSNLPVVVVDPLLHDDAIDSGDLGFTAEQPAARVGLMQAIHVGRERGWPVFTGEPLLARELGPDVVVEPLT
jgi:hypothetical protein